jgi:hypothetical protein
MFVVGTSTVSKMLRETVHAINDVLRHEIAWPASVKFLETQNAFKDLYGLPGVVGAIDGTHIAIRKPRHRAADYYYFKSGGYSLNCLSVVDSEKRFQTCSWACQVLQMIAKSCVALPYTIVRSRMSCSTLAM